MQRTLIEPKLTTTTTGASFSDCLKYRWTLWRQWGTGDLVNFLMLNPSTADHITNDPTVERCQRRATAWGYGGLIVTNLFAFRATDPKQMKAASDPVGADNDRAIIESASQARIVICAWGTHGTYRGRDSEVVRLLKAKHGRKLHILKASKDGIPMHPLYLPYALQPIPFAEEPAP